MKKALLATLVGFSAAILLSGCPHVQQCETTAASAENTPVDVTKSPAPPATAAPAATPATAAPVPPVTANVSGPATPISLTPYFNVAGITKDGEAVEGGLDGNGFSCSASLLASTQVWNGVTFNLGPAGASNAVTAAGQLISLPSGSFSTVRLLMTGVNGNQDSQNFIIAYADGATQTNVQSVSDWFTASDYPGEARAVSMNYRNQADGTKDEQSPFLVYGYSFALKKGQEARSLKLPDNGNVKVFAITMAP